MAEPVLEIKNSSDDLPLSGFSFEGGVGIVQSSELVKDYLPCLSMHSSLVVPEMLQKMKYMHGL